MKDWKTTLAGSVGGVPQVVIGILNKDWTAVITGIATILLGLFAKDGGTQNVGG